jgi:hypothetical protein
VRPTDEDQSGPRRPNLMSSARRTANEVNILAMLDRREAGGLQKRLLRGLRGRRAAFCYGAAGVLAVGLVSVLAWLVRDSDAPSAVDTALAGAITSGRQASATVLPPAALPAVADAVAETVTDAPGDAAPEAPAQSGATIVDVAPAPVILREPPRSTPHAGMAKAAQRPVASKPAAARAPLAHAETRSRRLAAPAKDAPAVDTDVALISAIIQHASKRQEAEEAARKP